MKKFSRVAWHSLNVILPLSETSRMVRAARYVVSQHADRFRRLIPARTDKSTPALSFDEAVRASGQSHGELMRRYLLAKRCWLLMFAFVVLFTLLMPVVYLFSGLPASGLFVVRMASLLFMLAGFTGLLFVRTMNNQYRLWQLHTHQLGTFAEWKTAERWLKTTLSWHLS